MVGIGELGEKAMNGSLGRFLYLVDQFGAGRFSATPEIHFGTSQDLPYAIAHSLLGDLESRPHRVIGLNALACCLGAMGIDGLLGSNL